MHCTGLILPAECSLITRNKEHSKTSFILSHMQEGQCLIFAYRPGEAWELPQHHQGVIWKNYMVQRCLWDASLSRDWKTLPRYSHKNKNKSSNLKKAKVNTFS